MIPVPPNVTQANIDLQNVSQRLVPILWRCHKYGFPIGSADLSDNVFAFKAEAWQKRLADLKTKLFDFVGKPFNLDNHHPTSKNGVRHFLYAKKEQGGLGLEPVKVHGKVCSNKYAVCKLHYDIQQNKEEELNRIFKTLIEIRMLQHRYRFATARMLLFESCKRCDDDTKFKCLYCGGTGHGKVLGFDPKYCSEKNGWIYLHPYFIQTQITLRVGCVDPNLEQVPRNNEEYGIDVRDQYCTEPDETFVFVDGAKTERLFAAIRFNDPVMLDEVRRGHAAVAEFGEQIFGVPASQIAKNSVEYATTKTLVYATQLGGQGDTVHRKFMENYRYFDPEYCQEMVDKCQRRYEAYYTNAKEEGWKALNDGYWVTYHGQRFLCEKPYNLDGYSHWKWIKSPRAQQEWDRFMRFFMASHIQGPATGFHIQKAALEAQDAIDRMLNPNWDESRIENGRPEIAQLCLLKHDELGARCKKTIACEVKAILEKAITNLEDVGPYLKTTMQPELKFDLKSEYELSSQWSVHQPENYLELTKEKNPLHYYNQQGLRFRA